MASRVVYPIWDEMEQVVSLSKSADLLGTDQYRFW
jgi:hypothetical protein